jgi:hypothetical protein
MSNAFNVGNGRFKPKSSTTGSPFTRTTKLPRPGLSGFIITVAYVLTDSTNFFALVMKADHCLQASIVTTTELLVEADNDGTAEA